MGRKGKCEIVSEQVQKELEATKKGLRLVSRNLWQKSRNRQLRFFEEEEEAVKAENECADAIQHFTMNTFSIKQKEEENNNK